MKRILAAFALLIAGLLVGAWAAAQVNGSGGVYINGVLQGVGGGTGTVTSVGLTLPSFMNVSGTNPITTSGTFVFGLANVSAGAVFTGPASGADAAPTFKAISSFAANPALSNLAGVEINTPLITGVGTSLDLEAGAPKTDAAADTAILKAGNAFPGAATNTAGANTILAGGIGKRIFTVVDYSHGSMSGSTVTITINGSATVLTEGVEWTAATNNNATAASLASALGGLSGMGASASAADVRIVADAGTYSLTIAKTAADAGMTATSGADGQLRLEGTLNGTSGAPPIVFGANNLGFYGYSNGIVYTYLGFPLSYFSTNGIVIYSTYQYLWGAGDAISTPDLGLARSSPGLLKVSDASTGYGNLEASTLYAISNVSAPLLSMNDGSGHTSSFAAATQSGNIAYTLPAVANVSGALRNDGTGSLTWGHELLTDQFTYTFFDLNTDLPATLDVPSIYVNRARAIHLTEIFCEIDAGSATVNLTKNGANIATADITCAVTPSGTDGTTGILDNSGSHFVSTKDAIAVGDKIGHVMVTVGASLKRLNVVVRYSVD